MDIQTSNLSDGILVTIGESRIDVACAVQFKDGVREISCGVDGRIVLDLQRVDFVDSSGLGQLLRR